ncbi:hypothetical protein C0991_000202 [Blastosporella zonata]|nr:hypothetical protein C0991_000202 [Blastosporella zonata]
MPLPAIDWAKIDQPELVLQRFPSRRSVVYGTKGVVASSQPLATEAGLEILRKGGNAADAAVATSAALNVTEPSCCGIGGDAFCLFYDAKTKKVSALNGSGRSPEKLSLDYARSRGHIGRIPLTDLNSVTVPGAAAAWVDTISEFGSGRLSVADVLEPAIRLAEEGVPVSEIHSHAWQQSENLIKNASPNGDEMLLNGKAPLPGQVIKLPNLAQTFRELATNGKDGFYKGRIAQAIVDVIQSRGGVMELEDMAKHSTDFVEPINYTYRNVTVYEINGVTRAATSKAITQVLGQEVCFLALYKHPTFKHYEAVPKGCGFTLQNRGCGFILDERHPNALKGGKRPYHTIIPAIVTRGDELFLSYGVMGGYMQPQGHVQVLLNILRGFTVQAALDAPRFCISAGLPDAGSEARNPNSEVYLEEGISAETIATLCEMGHDARTATGFKRGMMGRGQVIQKLNNVSGRLVWAAGSDQRADVTTASDKGLLDAAAGGEQGPLLFNAENIEPPPPFSNVNQPGPSYVPISGPAAPLERPPEFALYDADYFEADNGDIVSHDPHLNTDGVDAFFAALIVCADFSLGEALYRFLLAQADKLPSYRLHCRGTHVEYRTRWVTDRSNDGRTTSRRETDSETVVDFDFYIDAFPPSTIMPIHWSVGDTQPAYRGSMVRETESLGHTQNASRSVERAYMKWAKERMARGFPPWALSTDGWTEETVDDGVAALKSSKTLRQWADHYCASQKYLKEFMYDKVRVNLLS